MGKKVGVLQMDMAALFEMYARLLYRYAIAITGSAEDAEDVVQEVFLNVSRNRKWANGDEERARRYLYAATRNTAFSHLRKRKRSDRLHQAMCVELASGAQTNIEGQNDRAATLCQVFAGLPVEQREVLVLKIHDGMTFKEIAEAAKLPISTVSSRYKYAISKLRKTLGGDDDEE
ncbi:MAG: sigma-70 family RNA polymerase sigma factor [Armatimonadota bacterium]|nr:sigma-70 family RNA polymerase sigma factor [Armatimonadota bacterium]